MEYHCGMLQTWRKVLKVAHMKETEQFKCQAIVVTGIQHHHHYHKYDHIVNELKYIRHAYTVTPILNGTWIEWNPVFSGKHSQYQASLI